MLRSVIPIFLLAGVAAVPDHPKPPALHLPDPLVLADGSRVATKEQWFEKRRPELQEQFQKFMYGYLPPKPERSEARVIHADAMALGGMATLKEIDLTVGPLGSPPIHLLLVVPNSRKEPAPVFVGLTFCGIYSIVDDPAIRLPDCWMYPGHPGVVNNRATEAGRGKEAATWALEQSVKRGYAVALFYNGDIDPDRPDVRGGLRPFLPKGPECGCVALWAWGMSRVIDFLVTQPEIDAKRIASVGHSRLGKATLVAAAFDERIALAIPHQAGCGGTAPSRGTVGESVQRINDSFPHWFNAAFKGFNGQPEKLPFDQNGLVALVAPRPVLFSNAVEDTWANPAGQFEVLKAADPVYRLLGVEGLGAKEQPATGHLLASRLGYYIRPGKHSMTTQDWKIFLDFADQNLK